MHTTAAALTQQCCLEHRPWAADHSELWHPSGLPPLADWLILPAAKAFPELRSLQRVVHVAHVAQRCATAAHEPGRLPPVQLSLPLQLIERVAHCEGIRHKGPGIHEDCCMLLVGEHVVELQHLAEVLHLELLSSHF